MVRMIAHRGASRLAPENTLPAYELAGKYRYFGFECDVHETLDHEFVLMHDETINRMTNGTGNISDYTLEELKQCIIQQGAHFKQFPYLRIPTLKEYLQVCKRYSVTPVIEIKQVPNSSLKRLLTLVKQWVEIEQVIIISFHEKTLVEIRKLNPDIHLQWIAKLNEKNIQICAKHRMDIATKYTHVTEELVLKAHDAGILVGVWTVNEGTMLRKLIQVGVDAITTDYLMHHQLISSGRSFTDLFQNKEAYKSVLNHKLKETLKLELEKGSWRWDDTIKGVEVCSKPKIPVLLSISLPKVKEGDVVRFSFWCYQITEAEVLATVKTDNKNMMQTKTGLVEGWEYVELQGIVSEVSEGQNYIFELYSDSTKSAHLLIKQLMIKIDYM